jgi:FixJ family two-component response regulator
MSGPLLAQMLRERNPSLKTVLVSGYTRDKLTATGRLPPGVSFLQKPFSMETLASHMAELKIGSPQGDFGF